MIRYPDGSIRYFTVFEAKRIQTFPDDYVITGAWGEALRQIGNAVPVMLGEHLGQSAMQLLK
jgi:DNA (cytosine-5)-methyltransferase 1